MEEEQEEDLDGSTCSDSVGSQYCDPIISCRTADSRNSDDSAAVGGKEKKDIYLMWRSTIARCIGGGKGDARSFQGSLFHLARLAAQCEQQAVTVSVLLLHHPDQQPCPLLPRPWDTSFPLPDSTSCLRPRPPSLTLIGVKIPGSLDPSAARGGCSSLDIPV